jgi:cytosine/adenosine deaminase-related metal-dependent hydrolase
LLRLSAVAAQTHDCLRTTHLAESAEEFAMFRHAQGPLYGWLQRIGRDMSDCGGLSPVQHLARYGGLAANLLAVHVNYLAPGDARLLGRHGVSVVHCPRSHAYFRHRPFPYRTLRRAGVNVCLGTDSLATTRRVGRQAVRLDLFAEMRALADAGLGLSPESIVRMATVHGARALHQQGRLGELAPGAWADLIAVPYAGKLGGAWEALVERSGEVRAAMIGGAWVHVCGALPGNRGPVGSKPPAPTGRVARALAGAAAEQEPGV